MLIIWINLTPWKWKKKKFDDNPKYKSSGMRCAKETKIVAPGIEPGTFSEYRSTEQAH